MTTDIEIRPSTPTDLLAQAVEKGLDVAALEKLMALQERWEANQARKAYFEAFTNFQSNAPDIRKNKTADFGQGKASYKYAQLSEIARQIAPELKRNDLNYRWEIQDSMQEIKVTCLVSHKDGHTERTTMTGTPDTTGSKNAIQARGSAIEYLKRYTLIGALGLTTADSDVDGQMPEIDLDILHQQYMVHYNELIQIDGTYSKWHPDNFKSEKTKGLYIKAIGEIRKKLIEVTPKKV